MWVSCVCTEYKMTDTEVDAYSVEDWAPEQLRNYDGNGDAIFYESPAVEDDRDARELPSATCFVGWTPVTSSSTKGKGKCLSYSQGLPNKTREMINQMKSLDKRVNLSLLRIWKSEDDIQTERYRRAIADPTLYGFIQEYEFHHRE